MLNSDAAQILIESFAINADIIAMQTINKERELNGQSLAYTEEDFAYKAGELRTLARRI